MQHYGVSSAPVVPMVQAILISVIFKPHRTSMSKYNFTVMGSFSGHQISPKRKLMLYNRTYPLTKPVTTGAGSFYRIGLITDMDTESKGIITMSNCESPFVKNMLIIMGNFHVLNKVCLEMLHKVDGLRAK